MNDYICNIGVITYVLKSRQNLTYRPKIIHKEKGTKWLDDSFHFAPYFID